MLLNETGSIDHLNDFLIQRMKKLEHLLLTEDRAGLLELLQNDKENIARLQSELIQTGESIANINKVQQYASCA